VEGAHPCRPERKEKVRETLEFSTSPDEASCSFRRAWKPRLYGRQDARRYSFRGGWHPCLPWRARILCRPERKEKVRETLEFSTSPDDA